MKNAQNIYEATVEELKARERIWGVTENMTSNPKETFYGTFEECREYAKSHNIILDGDDNMIHLWRIDENGDTIYYDEEYWNDRESEIADKYANGFNWLDELHRLPV